MINYDEFARGDDEEIKEPLMQRICNNLTTRGKIRCMIYL